ncbi:MAG TPA: P1 family peptidase [Solirubrobacteraceae bacterium]|jgi:D-aminopeptidase|nr:P1 family peptidase [Solirubrobacteraceae bacterium]
MRARDYGIVIGDGRPGPENAITDVGGVSVGHTTLIEGQRVRTGVTVILPGERIWSEPVFAGCHRLNGNGEMTGLEWVRESGLLTSPVALTNTHSVGVVRDALIAHRVRGGAEASMSPWALPVVGETWDGVLNDIDGFHVRPEHVGEAMAAAAPSAVPEGNVGGGTGMICHGFKGGIGTASRQRPAAEGGYTVGVLVQANHGRRARLAVNGVPVGRVIGPGEVPLPGGAREPAPPPGAGSIIVVAGTDAPLLPHQCTRLAQRAGLGIARVGGVGEHTSGDIFLCFATGNTGLSAGELDADGPVTVPVTMLADAYITGLYDAVVEATEEAIVNALIAAETMRGRDDNLAHALDGERLRSVL